MITEDTASLVTPYIADEDLKPDTASCPRTYARLKFQRL